ncbi:hypothetical protein K438DRAFT_1961812 [Mycena galopus ATCC 62051]|nr:hypothetical protein K438DRAFT_1961812 [Mycena galopus ATCC 62051]
MAHARPERRLGVERRTRLRRLSLNSRYLHEGLTKLHHVRAPHVARHPAPAVQPRQDEHVPPLKEDAIVVPVVSYAACALMTTRVRFCVSAVHTKEDIDHAAGVGRGTRIGDVLDLKHGLPNSKYLQVYGSTHPYQ